MRSGVETVKITGEETLNKVSQTPRWKRIARTARKYLSYLKRKERTRYNTKCKVKKKITIITRTLFSYDSLNFQGQCEF